MEPVLEFASLEDTLAYASAHLENEGILTSPDILEGFSAILTLLQQSPASIAQSDMNSIVESATRALGAYDGAGQHVTLRRGRLMTAFYSALNGAQDVLHDEGWYGHVPATLRNVAEYMHAQEEPPRVNQAEDYLRRKIAEATPDRIGGLMIQYGLEGNLDEGRQEDSLAGGRAEIETMLGILSRVRDEAKRTELMDQVLHISSRFMPDGTQFDALRVLNEDLEGHTDAYGFEGSLTALTADLDAYILKTGRREISVFRAMLDSVL